MRGAGNLLGLLSAGWHLVCMPLAYFGYQVLYVGFLCLLPVCAFLSDGMDVCAHVPARVLS